jgi:MEDS: MEthanogen/methylotroph, DcmR Sensory domain
MTYASQLLEHPKPSGHFVQLYGQDDRLLTRNLVRYLSEGLRRGDGLLVIAVPEHIEPVIETLRQDRTYSRAVLEGSLVFLDAETTLSQIVVDDRPDRERFEAQVGGALRQVQDRAGHSCVRAYGEMVGLLWRQVRFTAAEMLEDYWNGLLRVNSLSLFCAYPIDIFGDDFRFETMDQVLCAHTHMLPVDDVLEPALDRAMNEVLGPRVPSLRAIMRANHRPSWGVVPKSEAIILWLRNNLPGSADEILQLARRYYAPLAAARA